MVFISVAENGTITGAVSGDICPVGFSPIKTDEPLANLVGGTFIDGVVTPKPLPMVEPMTLEEQVSLLVDLVAEQQIALMSLTGGGE